MSERMYKIGEAAQILKLKSYVLRFWETEFPQLNPTRTEKGQRLYTESDLELLKFIRHLLHERGLTIEGARKVLQSRNSADDMGLTSDFLDESYKDFGIEGLMPDLPESAEDDISGLTRQAELAASQSALKYALAELKSISSLLQKSQQPS